MNLGVGLIALTLVGAAMAQAPAGTVEVEAGGCKLYLPESEAHGASRVTWSGGCAEGLAQGRGVVRVYAGERLSLAAERTYSRGIASMIPSDAKPKAPPIQMRTNRQ
jgi:hypothetical protein